MRGLLCPQTRPVVPAHAVELQIARAHLQHAPQRRPRALRELRRDRLFPPSRRRAAQHVLPPQPRRLANRALRPPVEPRALPRRNFEPPRSAPSSSADARRRRPSQHRRRRRRRFRRHRRRRRRFRCRRFRSAEGLDPYMCMRDGTACAFRHRKLAWRSRPAAGEAPATDARWQRSRSCCSRCPPAAAASRRRPARTPRRRRPCRARIVDSRGCARPRLYPTAAAATRHRRRRRRRRRRRPASPKPSTRRGRRVHGRSSSTTSSQHAEAEHLERAVTPRCRRGRAAAASLLLRRAAAVVGAACPSAEVPPRSSRSVMSWIKPAARSWPSTSTWPQVDACVEPGARLASPLEHRLRAGSGRLGWSSRSAAS